MPAITRRRSLLAKQDSDLVVQKSVTLDSNSTPRKRKSTSDAAAKAVEDTAHTPNKLNRSPSSAVKTPTRLFDRLSLSKQQQQDLDAAFEAPGVTQPSKLDQSHSNSVLTTTGNEKKTNEKLSEMHKSTSKMLVESLTEIQKWNPKDAEQMRAVKEALHVSMEPSTVVCREFEQRRIFEFCKANVQHQRAGSLYICGCPGTGKSLSIGKVKELLFDWVNEAGYQTPDVLSINCARLSKTTDIFSKVLGQCQTKCKTNGSTSPLQHLQNIYSQKQQSSNIKMTLIIADELDFLITRDRAVLHDLFMLTTFPFSTCIIIGIANAIDLADRFLPRLQSLNCKPMVITFRAYSKDQILRILQERVMGFPYIVFQPQALELCARKVAAGSGDMRKALSVCRRAVEILEAELRESTNVSTSAEEVSFSEKKIAPAFNSTEADDTHVVRIHQMALALSKTYKSPAVDTIKSLPQQQQIILCCAVKSFHGGKKDTTLVELNKLYTDICKSVRVPSVGTSEFSSMCNLLDDMGLLKLGQSRGEKLRRVTLKVDESDVIFALQGIRFFRNFLQ